MSGSICFHTSGKVGAFSVSVVQRYVYYSGSGLMSE